MYAINYCSDSGCFINNFIIIDGYINGGYILFKLQKLNRLLDLCIVDSSLFALIESLKSHFCCFFKDLSLITILCIALLLSHS